MKERLRFAEAVCAGHPDRLADAIADRLVALAVSKDPDSLVGVEVAVHREVVFVDGRIACGPGTPLLGEADVEDAVREAYRAAGYGGFAPEPARVEIRLDLCLDSLGPEERAFRGVSDDQVIGVGYACRGERAGLVPLEQALARDFVKALEELRRRDPAGAMGPDGKALVAVRGRRLAAVSLSVHHAEDAEWTSLVERVRGACLAVAEEYVAAGELERPDETASWLFNGAGAFAVGGPLGDNGLSGKKLVAEAWGTAVPIGGGTVHGKDPHKPDVRAQRIARERAVDHVRAGAEEATVWVVFRPGDEVPAFVEEEVVRPGAGERSAA